MTYATYLLVCVLLFQAFPVGTAVGVCVCAAAVEIAMVFLGPESSRD